QDSVFIYLFIYIIYILHRHIYMVKMKRVLKLRKGVGLLQVLKTGGAKPGLLLQDGASSGIRRGAG
ncbi:hypothetical protein, partial [Escherichia coli]|uniref:hypothetical protein n=1 Tax=Escherichia coli TaxID=562 RepID=UPI00195ADDC8